MLQTRDGKPVRVLGIDRHITLRSDVEGKRKGGKCLGFEEVRDRISS